MKINKLLVLFFVLCMTRVVFAAKIEDVSIDKHKYYDNVVIITSQYITPQITLVDSPPRLVVDFKGVKVDKPKIYQLSSDRIKMVRISQQSKKPLIGRVVVDLKKRIDYESATIFGRNETDIEIREGSQPYIFEGVKKLPESKAANLDAKNKTAKGVSLNYKDVKTKKIAPYIFEIEKVKKTEPKQIMSKKEPKVVIKKPQILAGRVFVVDPGHGGADPGAFGLFGLVEKDVTLKTAYRLVEFLKKAGANVYLTRKQGIKIGLKQVVAFTNKIEPDAYIGIHYNATFSSKINGIETYYFNSRSNNLAKTVHENMIKKIQRPDRNIRQARFYTVHHTEMPAIIVEPAYITNPVEANLIRSDKFLKNIAWGITAGLKEYYKKWEK